MHVAFLGEGATQYYRLVLYLVGSLKQSDRIILKTLLKLTMASKTRFMINREPLLTLPTELWLHIASFVENRNELFALCGTSTTLRAIILPLLFQTVDLFRWQAGDRKQRRVEALRNPDVALVVTTLQVLLAPLYYCRMRGVDCRTCTTVDNIMGDALLAMANLESLYLSSSLCGGSREPRHAYIGKLVAPRLHAFNFNCRCCRGFGAIVEKGVLSLTSLATVRSFSCHVPDHQARYVLEDPNVLPLLRNLRYQGSWLDNLLLSTRPIERLHLQLTDRPSELIAAIDLSPGKLTHLITNFLETRIFQQISATTCSQLRHIGTFSRSEVSLA
jgi:hypothetical protein